jgi:hypothetical protein
VKRVGRGLVPPVTPRNASCRVQEAGLGLPIALERPYRNPPNRAASWSKTDK